MRIYKGFVRPSCAMDCEIPKEGLTAAEIMLLREIHGGSDAVVKIEVTGMDKRSHKGEYDRLVTKYDSAVNPDTQEHKMQKLFGPGHFNVKLPVDLPDSANPDADAYAEAEAKAFADANREMSQ